MPPEVIQAIIDISRYDLACYWS